MNRIKRIMVVSSLAMAARSIFMKKVGMLIAVVFVSGAMAQSTLAQTLVKFHGGIGDIPTGSKNTTVRGVPTTGQIWVIRDLFADVSQDGSIEVRGVGLLLGAGNGIGSNGNDSVFATLFCANDGNIAHISTRTGVALAVDGDFVINDKLSPPPPSTCTSPVLLIRGVDDGGYFAAGIPKPSGDEAGTTGAR
jgi:hypothetical protein